MDKNITTGPELRTLIKRVKVNNKRSFPVRTQLRSQSLLSIYSYKDFLIELITQCSIKQRVYHPHIPHLIVQFIPIYSWKIADLDSKQDDDIKVNLTHCNTIVSNHYRKLGVVLGSKLDPRLDHVVSLQLLDGVEFGFGICDETQLNENSMRDFMCQKGGYGYYNYKKESARMKLKSPPGFYWQIRTCRKIRHEAEICLPGDVLTMVIQRQTRRAHGKNPMLKLQLAEKYTLSFYKNGEDMRFHLRNLKGPFHICLNYYFSSCKVRLLSDYDFRREHRQWVSFQSNSNKKRPKVGKSLHEPLYHERAMVTDLA